MPNLCWIQALILNLPKDIWRRTLVGRIGYTLWHMCRHYPSLRTIKHQHACACVTDISPDYLAKHHIDTLALDFDGVLHAHGEVGVHEAVQPWLEAMLERKIAVYIVSNKPFAARLAWLKAHYPRIEVVQGTLNITVVGSSCPVMRRSAGCTNW